MTMSETEYGPKTPLAREVHAEKYRSEGETFWEAMSRVADALADDEEHRKQFFDIIVNQRFLPAGRVQAAMGAPKRVTPYNCFVSGTIHDSMTDIMGKAMEAAETLRMGGGIGYDFSTLRPRGARIVGLGSNSSGPVSFMGIYDALCRTISSAGHRRGAQMGVLRVDHPDIEEFITAKNNSHHLTNFNISVAVTDKFMRAVENGEDFDLVFEDRVYKTVDARSLWNKIMRSTWAWAEPGVIFIDKMNRKNNLWYCETIAATNPCGEQPLPPYGACLLGSFNLTKYLAPYDGDPCYFDWDRFYEDIPPVVRAMDNVVDRATYPLFEQKQEALNKRRMGLGITGLANTAEILGHPYASDRMKTFTRFVLEALQSEAYESSVDLAIEKGPFPLFDREKFLESEYARSLPQHLRNRIDEHGIRNSHLLSVAPTGTISLSADNVSSGLEPPYSLSFDRRVIMAGGDERWEEVKDYAYQFYGVKGRTALEISAEDHVDMLNLVSEYVDSACSKTCNVGSNVSFDKFKDLYFLAWKGGASGCTTFREDGERAGVLKASKDEEVVELENEQDDNFINETDGACVYDPVTQTRSCE